MKRKPLVTSNLSPIPNRNPKIAIVCDWLTNMGGAERVVLALHQAFPDAPIYTSVYDAESMPLFKDVDVRTTYLQRLPAKLRARHQLFPLIRANAFRRLDLSEYDIIISSASAEAKAIIKRPDATHICYCHTPTRYYWSHYHEYKSSPGFGRLNPAVRVALPILVGLMRRIDLRAVKSVDQFIANSSEVQGRIKQYYHRDSTVIFPPVDTKRLAPVKPVQKEDFYLVVGRQIPYKRIDLAIEACNKLKKRLVVIGNGSEHAKLVKLAGPTAELIQADDQQIVSYFQRAKALIFTSEEDFGITPVEAMAAGTPVIAFNKGGAKDYITKDSGVFFDEQTPQSLAAAINLFEQKTFDHETIQKHAEKFSEEVFVNKVKEFIDSI